MFPGIYQYLIKNILVTNGTELIPTVSKIYAV